MSLSHPPRDPAQLTVTGQKGPVMVQNNKRRVNGEPNGDCESQRTPLPFERGAIYSALSPKHKRTSVGFAFLGTSAGCERRRGAWEREIVVQ